VAPRRRKLPAPQRQAPVLVKHAPVARTRRPGPRAGLLLATLLIAAIAIAAFLSRSGARRIEIVPPTPVLHDDSPARSFH
jgi:hypothetical protein